MYLDLWNLRSLISSKWTKINDFAMSPFLFISELFSFKWVKCWYVFYLDAFSRVFYVQVYKFEGDCLLHYRTCGMKSGFLLSGEMSHHFLSNLENLREFVEYISLVWSRLHRIIPRFLWNLIPNLFLSGIIYSSEICLIFEVAHKLDSSKTVVIKYV